MSPWKPRKSSPLPQRTSKNSYPQPARALSTGGLNFDAKRRRESFEPVDLFHSHIAGMDAMAHGLEIAAAIQADGRLDAFVRDRYASWDGDLGQRIMSGKSSLADLRDEAERLGEVPLESGRQEMLENLFNRFL